MKFFALLRIFVFIIAGLIVAAVRAEAQGIDFSVTPSATSLVAGSALIYTIDVTNFTGVPLEEVYVTNTFSAPFELINATTDFGTYLQYSNSVVFYLDSFSSGEIAIMSLEVEPLSAGYLTNTVSVSSPGFTNSTTNVLVDVTNVVSYADLSVTISGPTQPVITNDWMTYGFTVSNAGPSAASGVFLTNIVPVTLTLVGFYPTNLAGKLLTNGILLALGTIPAGGSTNVELTVESPIAGTNLPFSALVGSASITDTNTSNNSATTNLTIMNYLPGLLTATSLPQTTNFQNGLGEQVIILSNAGKSDVPAERLVVTGLPKRLFNAVGTNSGYPFVTLGAPLDAGRSVTLLLQYDPRGAFPFTNSQLEAFAVPLPNLTPPATTGTTTNINITGIYKLADGNVLIEFPATNGQSYTVVYSDNILFSNAMVAPPAITAPANVVQWIDYGPPTTISAPTNSSARFYRIIQNP